MGRRQRQSRQQRQPGQQATQTSPQTFSPASSAETKESFSSKVWLLIIGGIITIAVTLIVNYVTKSNEPIVKRSGDVINPTTVIVQPSKQPTKVDLRPSLFVNYNGMNFISNIESYKTYNSDTTGLTIYTKNIGTATATKIVVSTALILPKNNKCLIQNDTVQPSYMLLPGDTQMHILHLLASDSGFLPNKDALVIFIKVHYQDSLKRKFVSNRCLQWYRPSLYGKHLLELPAKNYATVKSILQREKLW